MNILVTGGAGFIGSHLAEKLVNLGHEVIVVDNLNLYYSPKLKLENIKALLGKENFVFEYGDIVNKDFLNNIFLKHKIEAVVHLAAQAGVRHSILKPLWYKETNITGTVNLLELAKQYEIKNFIFASSSSVYGEKTKGPFKEEDDTSHPISPYAASKKAGEVFCYTYSQLTGLPVTVLRLFNVYGPKMRPELAMPLFVRGIKSGQLIVQYGDGTMRRSYTYIDDVIEGIVLALENPKRYRVLNLGNQETISLRDLIKTIEDIYGRTAIKEILPKPAGDVSLTFADSRRIKNELSWEAKIGFQEGCRKFVSWYEKYIQQMTQEKNPVYLEGITKKVLIFSLNYAPYMDGAETAVKEITNKIDHYSYDLICARFNRQLPKVEKIGNVKVYRVGLGLPIDKFFYPWLAFFRALSLKSKNSYHIIWSVMDSYAGLVGALTKLSDIKMKFLISLFRVQIRGWQKIIWFPFSRLIYRLVDRLHITVVVQAKRAKKAGYKGEINLVPNGVMNDVFKDFSEQRQVEYRDKLGFKEDDRVLLSVLNINDNSAYWELFSIMKKMADNYKLILVVDKEFKDKIVDKIRIFKLNNKVKLVIRNKDFDIAPLLDLVKVFIRPTGKEAAPVYILEAMLRKVPIVAAKNAALSDLIINYETALTYEPDNYPAAIDAIRQIINDAQLRSKLVKRAYNKAASSYDWESAAEKIKQIFDKM